MAIYIMKNGGLEWLLNDMGFVPNLSINVENLSFFMFPEPYMHVQDRVFVRMHCGCACRLIPTCVCQGLPWLYFSKNKFICSLKVIFFILTFLKLI